MSTTSRPVSSGGHALGHRRGGEADARAQLEDVGPAERARRGSSPRPEVGCISVSASCSSVVLPAPFGPEDHPALVVVDRPVDVVEDVAVRFCGRRTSENCEHAAACCSSLSADAGDLRVERARARRRSTPQLKSFVGALAAGRAHTPRARSGSLTTSVSTAREIGDEPVGIERAFRCRPAPARSARAGRSRRRRRPRGCRPSPFRRRRRRTPWPRGSRCRAARRSTGRRTWWPAVSTARELVARQQPVDPDDARALVPAARRTTACDLGHDLAACRARPRTGSSCTSGGSSAAARRR